MRSARNYSATETTLKCRI